MKDNIKEKIKARSTTVKSEAILQEVLYYIKEFLKTGGYDLLH